jgi:hypothetical protein
MRLLELIVQISAPLTVDQWFKVQTAAHNYSGGDREKSVEFMKRLGHARSR